MTEVLLIAVRFVEPFADVAAGTGADRQQARGRVELRCRAWASGSFPAEPAIPEPR